MKFSMEINILSEALVDNEKRKHASSTAKVLVVSRKGKQKRSVTSAARFSAAIGLGIRLYGSELAQRTITYLIKALLRDFADIKNMTSIPIPTSSNLDVLGREKVINKRY